MSLVTLPRHPHQTDTQWPVRRAIVLWLATSAAFWIPIAVAAYWFLDRS